MNTGPLAGLRVVEFEGLGPGPLAGMLLADWGADVVVVGYQTEFGAKVPLRYQIANRGKRRVAANLKSPEDLANVLQLLDSAEVLLEGYRPGTMERLGLGPAIVHQRNPRLVYTRITGWGQTGTRAKTAGHDIGYIAMTGALSTIGRADGAPVPPVNYLGDYAGGTMFAVAGTLVALLEANRSGRGQVVDAAMVDGVGALMAPLLGMAGAGMWSGRRGTNLLDTGAPFYDVYRTADDRWLAIGALEDKFFAELLAGLGLDPVVGFDRWNPVSWPALKAALANAVAGKTRDQWTAIFAGTDACVSPVLTLDEAIVDPDNVARGAFSRIGGVAHPGKAPRFDRTALGPPTAVPEGVEALCDVVRGWAV